MELTYSNCFGPPIITLGGLVAFGLAASLLLVIAWARFGTGSLLFAWWGLFATGWSLLLLRMWRIGEFDGSAAWWLPSLAPPLATVFVGTLLTAVTSALLWDLLPRTLRPFQVVLTAAASAIAFFWASVSSAMVESMLYTVLG